MQLLSSQEAANILGVSVLTLYDWLTQSDAGIFQLRGEPTVISYYQGGRKGQGRIRIAESEVQRLLSLTKVAPIQARRERRQVARREFTHITTKPGRPDD